MSQTDYHFHQHILRQQAEMEKSFLDEFAAGSFPFDAPLVKQNPYAIAPLTALVLFRLEQPEAVTVCVKGKTAAADMRFSYPAAREQFVSVYGLYADASTEVVLTLESGAQKTLFFTAAAAPDCIRKPDYIKTAPEYFGNQVMLLAPSSASKMAAFDYAGDLRWYTELDMILEPKRLKNGHFLAATERLISLPYYITGVYEFSLIGKIYHEYRYPGGLHHDMTTDSDGNLLILTEDLTRDTVEDMIEDLDKDTGEVIRTFYLRHVITADAVAGNRANGRDWIHVNALWYDESTNSISVSGRNLDAVINLDYTTGGINWILGDPDKWPQDYVQKHFFTPEENQDEFDWFYAQHSCELLPGGDVMVFDNGAWRSKYSEKDIPAQEKFSRGVRYHIDTERRTVRQVWQYGKERGITFFSPHISNVHCYSDGHYLVHSGDIGQIAGKPCVKPPVFYLNKPEAKDMIFYSVTTELLNDEVVYEMRIPSTAYFRARKECLYDERDVLTFGEGTLLGSLGKTPVTRVKVPQTVAALPEGMRVSVDDEIDRFRFAALLPGDEYAVLVLKQNDDSVAYLVPSDEKDELAMCISTLRPENENERFVTISKDGLQGDYHMYLLAETTLYDLDTVLRC